MTSGNCAARASSEAESLVMDAVSAPDSRARRTTSITSGAAPDEEMPSTSAFSPKFGTTSYSVQTDGAARATGSPCWISSRYLQYSAAFSDVPRAATYTYAIWRRRTSAASASTLRYSSASIRRTTSGCCRISSSMKVIVISLKRSEEFPAGALGRACRRRRCRAGHGAWVCRGSPNRR